MFVLLYLSFPGEMQVLQSSPFPSVRLTELALGSCWSVLLLMMGSKGFHNSEASETHPAHTPGIISSHKIPPGLSNTWLARTKGSTAINFCLEGHFHAVPGSPSPAATALNPVAASLLLVLLKSTPSLDLRS